MGKSAQFLLHTWLPDAMEGPTPVSALIHAATMVTAGVFMVARMSPVFEYAPAALSVVAVIGATTAFFEDVDRQLPAERDVDGTPSAHDFLVVEMTRVIEVFATDFDQLPTADVRVRHLRVLISAGLVVRRFAVFGRLLIDGSIDLVGVEIDV